MKDPRARFWNFVAIGVGCWPWTGAKHRDGYGRFNDRGGMRIAHRVAWEITNGEIPDDMDVLHRCDNRACCRPDHLWLGDHDANMKDCKAKGRYAHGETARHKLTEAQVLRIRRVFKRTHANKSNIPDLAKRYRVYPGTIRDVVLRLTWTHLP